MILNVYFNICVGVINLVALRSLKMSNKKPLIKNQEAYEMAKDMTDNIDSNNSKLLDVVIDLMYFVPVLNILLSIATIKMYVDSFSSSEHK